MSASSGVNDYVTGLGVLAHGPAVLSRGPGIGIGLQCVFAYPTGLLLSLEVKAIDDTAGLIHKIQWRPSRPSRRGGRQRSPGLPRSHWQLTAFTDGLEQPLVVHSTFRTLNAHGGSDTKAGEPLYTEDHDTWLPQVPADTRLTLRAGWPEVGAPLTSTILILRDLAAVQDQVVKLR